MTTFTVYVQGIDKNFWGYQRAYSLAGAIATIEEIRKNTSLKFAKVTDDKTGKYWVKRFAD